MAEAAPAAEGQPPVIRGLMLDITEHKRANELACLAMHDALTSLPNRRMFREWLSNTLNHACREESVVAVFFIDLDHFKQINDSLGHSTGDAVLKEVATRLKQSLRDSDTVVRLGGDEFAMVVGPLAAPGMRPSWRRKSSIP